MIEFWLMSFWSNREDTGGQIELSKGQKAKEGAKTATYSLVIIAGLGAIGTVFYTLFRLGLCSIFVCGFIFDLQGALFVQLPQLVI